MPTPSGLKLYELLAKAAPSLVDPGTTAQWEMRLDEVVLGQNDFRAVIDGIAKSAAELISNLQQQANVKVDLAPAVRHAGSGRSRRLPPEAASPARKRTRGPVRPRGSQGPQTEAAVSPPWSKPGLKNGNLICNRKMSESRRPE